MKINYLFIITLISLFSASAKIYANSDSLLVYSIVDTIESFEKNSLEKTVYISKIDHIHLELNSPLFYPYIKEEFDNSESINSLDTKFDIYHLMEAIYYTFDDYEKASTIAYELLKIAQQSQDSIHFYYSYSTISSDEEHLGNKYSTIDFLLKANQYAQKNNHLLSKSNIELGMAFLDIEDYDKTRSYLTKGIEIARKENDESHLTYGYSIMAEFLYEIKQYDEALKYCHKVDSMGSLYPILNASSDVLYNNIYLGKIYTEKNNWELADKHFEIANNLASKAGNLLALSSVYESQSELAELKGNHQLSLNYYKEFNSVEESIFQIKAINNLNKLKVASEIAKKDLEIQISKKKEAFSKKRSFYVSITAIVVIFCFIILLLYSKSKLKASRILEELSEKKNKLNQIEIENLESKVQMKNKELANLFLHQFEKAELVTTIIQNLDKSNSLLTNELQEKLDSKEDWGNFKLHFDKVHEGFFLKLNNISDKLTSKDIKYCAYIRMNLSSKEIAIMLGISHRTVEGIRGRVRKKLGLTSDIDLVLFLMNL